MMIPESEVSQPFESLREKGRQQAESGQLEEALATFEEAVEWAREHGTREQLELADCNRISILIYLGHDSPELISTLRRILMGSASLLNRYFAAYHVSIFHDLQGDREKELFYGRIALDYAQRLGDPRHVARGHNRVGNSLLTESRFSDAREEYAAALELTPEDAPLDRAYLLENLGYCDVVLGTYGDGFGSLFRSLRMLRQLGDEERQHIVHMDLAFAYLEVDRFADARRHALRAYRWFGDQGDSKHLKNCLFLLGEAEKHSGHYTSALGYYDRLQGQFFPENPYLARTLMGVDVRRMINLRA